jgi:hypothetical protein
MSEDWPKEELERLYREWLNGGMGEGIFTAIESILTSCPDLIGIFIDKFHNETNLMLKELQAEIILRQQYYQPAVDFLRNEMKWDEEDIWDYIGRWEAKETNEPPVPPAAAPSIWDIICGPAGIGIIAAIIPRCSTGF